MSFDEYPFSVTLFECVMVFIVLDFSKRIVLKVLLIPLKFSAKNFEVLSFTEGRTNGRLDKTKVSVAHYKRSGKACRLLVEISFGFQDEKYLESHKLSWVQYTSFNIIFTEEKTIFNRDLEILFLAYILRAICSLCSVRAN